MAMTYIDTEEYRDLVQCKTCLDIIINSFGARGILENSWYSTGSQRNHGGPARC